MNPEIGKRYFYQVEFLPYTTPDLFTVNKSPDTFRIFCLGASTTVGYPYWYNASFSSFLRERLHTMFPQKKLEIINLGLTATNSFTVNDMAEELPQYQPDLIIVYDGHNEFYGALGAASRETFGSSRFIGKLYLKLIHVKSFLFFRDIITKTLSLFSSTPEHKERGTTMERLARGKYIPHSSQVYKTGLETFKENLDELKNICRTNHIPVILSSQVSNVRGQQPFIAGDFPSQEFKKKYEAASELLIDGKIDEAASLLKELLLHDSTRADVHYRLAQCFDKGKNFSSAQREYIKAKDYDQLRFRASSDLNSIIHHACDNELVYFADMEKVFAANSTDSLVGSEFIFEHLHPTSQGYFFMAKAYADVMQQYDLFATRDEWNAAKVIHDNDLWNERPVTELDERLAERKVEILTAGWPFTNNTVPIVSTVPAEDVIGNIVELVVRNKIDWLVAHRKAAEHYLKNNDKLNAVKEYETIVKTIPYDVQPYLNAARIYLDLGNLEKVKEMLVVSLTIKKTILAYRALGDVALRQHRYTDAVAYYEGMSTFDQNLNERLENGYLLALAQYKAGNMELAHSKLLSLLQIKPDFNPAVELLIEMQKAK